MQSSELYDARMNPPKTSGSWIQVKINERINMPVHQMALLSDSCPGHFFYADNHASYLIFSDEGLPDELASIPQFLNNHPCFSSLLREIKCVSATRISELPENVDSLHQKIFEKNDTVSGSHLICLVQKDIKSTYDRQLGLLVSANASSAQASDIRGIIIKLEQTAVQLYKLRNSEINIITAINYISHVLLTNSDTYVALSVPPFENNAACHHFRLTKK